MDFPIIWKKFPLFLLTSIGAFSDFAESARVGPVVCRADRVAFIICFTAAVNDTWKVKHLGQTKERKSVLTMGKFGDRDDEVEPRWPGWWEVLRRARPEPGGGGG